MKSPTTQRRLPEPLRPTATPPLSVAVVDDQEVIRLGLERMLERIGGYRVVLSVTNLRELEQARAALSTVTIVVVHLQLPERDGYMTLAWLRDNYPDVLAVGLVAQPDDAATQQAMRLRARAVLPRDLTADVLRTALHDVRTGGFHRNAAVDRLLIGPYRTPADLAQGARNHPKLSPRERELLRWLSHPSAYSLRSIAKRMGVGLNTVRTWNRRIRRKLRLHDRAQVVRFALAHRIEVQ